MNKGFKYIAIGIIILVIIGALIIAFIIKSNSKRPETFNVTSKIDYQIYNNFKQGGYDYTKKGYYVDSFNRPNSPYYYIITMGEKSTGGYSIEIVDIKIDEENNAKVVVQENEPSAGDFVTDVFTYPAVCLELSGYPKSIEIKNTVGEVFKELN